MFLILLTILTVYLVIFFNNNRKERYKNFWKYIKAIPGPQGYPVIGNGIAFHTPETQFISDRKMAKIFYPIFKKWSFNIPVVILMSPEDIELVLKNNAHNTKSTLYSFLHSWLGTGLLTSEGTKWHARRKFLTPAFHFNILQDFIVVFNKEAQILVENLQQLSHQPYINVVKHITEFSLFAIGETILGVNLREDPEHEAYKTAMTNYLDCFAYLTARPWLLFPQIYRFSSASKIIEESVKILHNFSFNVISEKYKILGKDGYLNYNKTKRLALLDLMLKAKYDGADIDDEGIREELDTFIGGHETTSVALCFHLVLLANNPEIQEKLYEEIIKIVGKNEIPDYNTIAELKYMERCIKESLRLYPSAPILGRIAGEDIQTKTGYTIPKGCNIYMLIYDMHRAEQIWENPEKFDPDRFLPENSSVRHPFAFIPFSAGSRNCIGQKFAMLEMKVVLCGILRKFKLEPYDRLEHIRMKADIVLRPIQELRVKFVPR